MSDLYVDLKRMIPVVTEWTAIGSDELQRAQDRTGLSDERLAREIPISAKTWVRWKRRGEVPTHLLPRVAPLLGFEVVPVSPVPIPMELPAPSLLASDLREAVAVLVDLVRSLAETAERCELALGRIEQATRERVEAQPRARRR